MSVLQRRPAMLGSRRNMSARDSTDSNETLREQVVIVGEDYESPQKEMDFPYTSFASMSGRAKPRIDLRIKTSKTELHDRYMSSEEEPSPSADGHQSHDEELRHKPSVRFSDEASHLMRANYSKAEIAIAVPIFSLGRPKLIDITNIAPIQRRKQRIPKSQAQHSAFKILATRLPAVVNENLPFLANEAAEVVTSPASIQPVPASNRSENRHVLTAPDSWLPSDEPVPSEDERYISDLDVRRTPSYHDYDPYSLEPPRLVASAKQSRARGSSGSGAPHANTSGWKGLTRSLSLAKKQNSHQQAAKKPKMIARGANAREEMLVVPPFPFESGDTR
ncbi:hypothetical protein G7Y79_00027g059740 [Physcia stellaris]|nr:hypothetical protein G7Y79_00027g059740 [Physcia stellaris]